MTTNAATSRPAANGSGPVRRSSVLQGFERALAAGSVVLLLAASAATADTPPPAAGLDAPVRASWTRVPIRLWADGATRIAGMPVIVDRRLDPAVAVTLDCRGEPLRDVLDRVAAAAGAEVDVLRSSLRIVPHAVAGRAVAAEAARDAAVAGLPAAMRRQASAREAWSWPAAATPRDLVATVAGRSGLGLTGIETIPHDHFPAASLPPLSLAERLDLVLAHVDRRIAWTADGGAIVPIDAGLGALADGTAAAPVAPQPRRDGTRKPGVVRDLYSLRVEAPLDQALEAIATRLDLDLALDAASLSARGIAPAEIVRVDVRDATRDELLDAVVKPLGLAWTITGGQLRVQGAR
jgi:hypothetical protein